jgi:hypothetical protein
MWSSPLAYLVVCGVASGLGTALVFRHISNQDALRRAAAEARACMMGLRLFKDDPRAALGCQAELLRAVGRRLRHSLRPALILVVPFVLILAQLAARFERRPLAAGETAVVALSLEPEAWRERDEVTIQAPLGMKVETPALRDAKEQALYWRIRVRDAVPGDLTWRIGDTMVTRHVRAASDTRRLASLALRQARRSWPGRLLHPGEPPLAPTSPARSIDVHYPDRVTPVFGHDMPWWATYIVITMVTAMAMKPVLGVHY